jgi:hypothetical protein
MGPHDEFLELCAVFASGELCEEEQTRLKGHLEVCLGCREALLEYASVVSNAIPAIGAEQVCHVDAGPGWDQRMAEKAFFNRLEEEGGRRQNAHRKNGLPSIPRRVIPTAPESTWHHAWMLYAAGILLFATLCVSTYWLGVRHGTDVAKSTPRVAPPQSAVEKERAASIEEELSDAAHERELARSRIAVRDKALAELRRQLQRQSTEIARMKEARDRLEASLDSNEAGKQDLVQQRTESMAKLEAAEAESRALQHQVNSLTQLSTNETARANALSSEVDDLSHLLKDRESALNQQDELLAHDRDIRELIGARHLFITEVYDTDEKGCTRKPYGRVFYTKEKSLIFYAYDLELQDAKPAQTFQAWGRRGPDWKQSVSLGIFYQDNAPKKRWVLKSDDPKTLAHIDAVFVTLEPRGGSDKPSGKPFLFAYFNNVPNHP